MPESWKIPPPIGLLGVVAGMLSAWNTPPPNTGPLPDDPAPDPGAPLACEPTVAENTNRVSLAMA